MAVLSSSLRGCATCAEPSLTISSRQVALVRRASSSAGPVSVNGFGLPRLTSVKFSGLVRKLFVAFGVSMRSLLAQKGQAPRPAESVPILLGTLRPAATHRWLTGRSFPQPRYAESAVQN